jgi:hypothetical protein
MLATDISTLRVGEFDVTQLTAAPLRLEKAARLKAPQAVIFEVLSNHEQWPGLFPWINGVSIDNSQAIVENGLGARRVCNFGNNMVLEEVIVGWNPPGSYAYAVLDDTHPFGMTGHVVVVRCDVVDGDTTKLAWQHFFDHPNLAAMLQQLDATMSLATKSLLDRFGGQPIEE